MHLVASAGVGAGHREQRDLLALEDIVGGLDLRTFRRHHAKFCFRQLVANFDGHGQISLNVRMFLKACFGGKETTSPSFDGCRHSGAMPTGPRKARTRWHRPGMTTSIKRW